MNKDINLSELLNILELPCSLVSFLALNLSFKQAQHDVENLKKAVKKQRKLLSKKYHPDLGHGDIEKMKLINDAVDKILMLKVFPAAPQPVTIIRTIRYSGTATSKTSNTFSGSWFG